MCAGCLLIASFSCQDNLLGGSTWFFDMPSLLLLAVELLQKLVMYAGLLVVIESMVIVLTSITSLEVLGPNVAVGLLVILYVAIIEILLLPLNVITQKKIAEYMEEDKSPEEQY